MKKFMRKNGDGTILFRSQRDLDAYINERTKHFVAKHEDEQRVKATASVLDVVLASIREALYLEFGFSYKRQSRLIARFNDVMDSIGKGYVTVEDLKAEWNKREIELGD